MSKGKSYNKFVTFQESRPLGSQSELITRMITQAQLLACLIATPSNFSICKLHLLIIYVKRTIDVTATHKILIKENLKNFESICKNMLYQIILSPKLLTMYAISPNKNSMKTLARFL